MHTIELHKKAGEIYQALDKVADNHIDRRAILEILADLVTHQYTTGLQTPRTKKATGQYHEVPGVQ